MLTKNDLTQIRDVVKEVVQVEVEPIKQDVKLLQKGMVSMQADVGSLLRDIKILKTNDTKIRKDLKTTIDYFDRDNVVLHKKVERIEKHLGLANN
ncbi:MAG TPA: hypothetical protein VM077_03970 [Candidatus Limnocylindrales bacterium]|nr:hypothetical protein [Candidatus Limnocylindrales bacterium]